MHANLTIGARMSRTGDDGRIYPLLRRTPLSRFLEEGQLAELQRHCEAATGRPGETLYRQGDAAGRMFLVPRGTAELRARPPGRHAYRTVEVVADGCTFGDEAVLGEERYMTSARAQSDCDLLIFGRDELERLFEARPDIAVGILRCAGSCLVQMVRRAAILTQARADVALDILLRELASSNGGGSIVRITHAQLAGLLHLSRETVSRMLGQMAAEGRIELARGAIRLRS